MLRSESQLRKVDASRHFRRLGMVMIFSSEQSENAPVPMLVTESGIFMPASDEQSKFV
ncbi:MAG: hypothetical protein HUK08_09825 [Bacteroidaceae bacterium]|nr:hypothetical protein [Bacteroidaceae bacterium]